MTAILTLLAATIGIAAPPPRPDTIPPALSSFGAEHDMLLNGFDAALNRAVLPAAADADRAAFVRYLRSSILPHALIEERVLYPALDSVLGTHGYATATLILDHRAIARRTIELAAVAPADTAVFSRRALAIATLIENHFAQEEDFVLPNLARKMKDRDLRALLARMDAERVAP